MAQGGAAPTVCVGWWWRRFAAGVIDKFLTVLVHSSLIFNTSSRPCPRYRRQGRPMLSSKTITTTCSNQHRFCQLCQGPCRQSAVEARVLAADQAQRPKVRPHFIFNNSKILQPTSAALMATARSVAFGRGHLRKKELEGENETWRRMPAKVNWATFKISFISSHPFPRM